MKNQTIATLLAGLLALSATQAQARDIFDADWGADGNSCQNNEQCWIEIEKPGKANKYTLKFIVADRFDASKVRCSAEATAEKSSRGNFLAGEFTKTGQPFRVFPWKGDGSKCMPSVRRRATGR
jgi:hypothetical protein